LIASSGSFLGLKGLDRGTSRTGKAAGRAVQTGSPSRSKSSPASFDNDVQQIENNGCND